MWTCNDCQSQLLDHLFGLLDETEERELQKHLIGCSDCAAALRREREFHGLLSRAARQTFPEVAFTAPRAETETPPPVAGATPLAVPRVKTPKREATPPRKWGGWMVAASLLVGTAALAIPAAGQYFGWKDKAAQVNALEEQVKRNDTELVRLNAELASRRQAVENEFQAAAQNQQQINADWGKALSEAKIALEQKQLHVRVTGPERPQPGGVNEWRVETLNRNNIYSRSKIQVAFRDAEDHEVYKQVFDHPATPPVVGFPVEKWADVKGQDLYLDVVSFDDNAQESKLVEKLDLAQPVFVTQLATDKPMYQVGQTVYFRSLTLDRGSFQPPTKEMQLDFKLTKPDGSVSNVDNGSTKLVKSDGTPVLGPDGKPITGVGTGSFPIEKGFPGGEYTLAVNEVVRKVDPRTGIPTVRLQELAKRKFLVNTEIVLDKFFKKLEFDGKSYGGGDLVQLRAEATRAEGPLNKVPVEVQVRVEGQAVKVNPAPTTNEKGEFFLSFRLPKQITRGEGSVTVTFRDKDTSESIVRPIPLVGKQLQIAFYPEGGDLVNGLPSRVYFQVKLPNGKPADVKGYLTDGTNKLSEIATLTDVDEAGVSRGQGVFAFTPEAGKDYFVKLTQPLGIDEPKQGDKSGFPLPKAKPDGVVLSVPNGVVGAGEPLVVGISSKARRNLLVGAYARGRLVDHERLTVDANQTLNVKLKADQAVGGVTRVTVFEEVQGKERIETKPVAERLVYRKLEKQLLLNVQPDQNRYNPGSKVGLEINALNDKEQRTPAVLMVAVINQSVVNMADLKTDHLMPTHFLLASEVEKPEDLEHADFLLTDHPKAPVALDLLLGTQGWRRFAEQSPEIFQQRGPRPEVDRLLVAIGQKSAPPRDTNRLEEERVNEKFAAQAEKSLDRVFEASKKRDEFLQKPNELTQKIQAAQQALNSTRAELNKAVDELADYESGEGRSQAWAVPLLCAALLITATVLLVMALGARKQHLSPLPRFAGAGICLALGTVALVAMVGMEHPAAHERNLIRMERARTEFAARDARQAEAPPMPMAVARPPMMADNAFDGAMEGKVINAPADRLRLDRMNRLEEVAEAANVARFGAPGGPPVPGPVPVAPVPAALPGMAPAPAALKADPAARNNLSKVKESPPRVMAQMKAEKAEKPAGEVNQEAKGDAKRQPVAEEELKKQLADLEKAKDMPRAGDDKAPDRLDKDQKRLREAERHVEQQLARETPERRQLADAAKKRKQLDLENGAANRALGLGNGVEARAGGKAMPQGLPAGMAGPPVNGRGLGGGGFAPGGPPGAGGFGGLGGGPGFGMGLPAEPEVLPLFVREYAHVHQPSPGDLRTDFAETVLWQPVLVLPESGSTKLSFDLSDDVAKYQVIVAGHTMQGQIGATKLTLEARKPFSLDPKLPTEVTAGDRIDLAVRAVNDSNEKRVVTYTVQPRGFDLDKSLSDKVQDGLLRDRIELAADAKGRKVYSLRPTAKEGKAAIRLDGSSEPMAPRDFIEREIKVVPDGFPMVGAYSDLLEGNSSRTIGLPKDLIPGSLQLSLNLYPTTLADLQSGLEGLLREPNGCFEQTSTSNYPNTLILDYLETSDQANPQASKRARDLIQRGYQKLTSFECQKPAGDGRQGYEWFGGAAPPHEALTAYGLLQFRDMARVYPVDPEMLARTQQYLMSAKDDTTGGFRRNARALDSFGGAPEHITNAYIVWALTESDPDDKLAMDLKPQFARLKKEAEQDGKKDDAYFLALIANSLLNRGTEENRELALKYLDRIASKQDASGFIPGATTSITRSGGRDLQIETTAIAVLGFLKANRADKFQQSVAKAAKWIGQQRGGYGGFGSTQSTILALKALIAFTKVNAHPAEDGTISLTIKGKATKTFKKEFTKADREVVTLTIDNPEELLQPGDNEVTVEITKTAKPYPFSVAWVCRTTTPDSSPQTSVELKAKLDREEAEEGQTVRLDVSLKNLSDKDTGMATTILGLPAGTIVPRDMKQLTKLREDGKISYFELRGREVILYWRALQPKQNIELAIDLICETPGEYRGPASRAYLYYNADHKHWIDPLKVRISPAK